MEEGKASDVQVDIEDQVTDRNTAPLQPGDHPLEFFVGCPQDIAKEGVHVIYPGHALACIKGYELWVSLMDAFLPRTGRSPKPQVIPGGTQAVPLSIVTYAHTVRGLIPAGTPFLRVTVVKQHVRPEVIRNVVTSKSTFALTDADPVALAQEGTEATDATPTPTCTPRSSLDDEILAHEQ